MIVLMIMGFMLIAFLEVPGLIRKRWWRELFWYSIFLVSGFVLCLLLMLGVKFPDISQVITSLVNALLSLSPVSLSSH